MQIARVVGNVVCTVKDSGLGGRKLLVLQPLSPDGATVGSPVVGVDGVGVGVGELVFYARGREASFVFLPEHVPTDIGIVGKIDSVDTPSLDLGRPRKSK